MLVVWIDWLSGRSMVVVGWLESKVFSSGIFAVLEILERLGGLIDDEGEYTYLRQRTNSLIYT